MNFPSLAASFRKELFDSDLPIFIARAPGRLDLMGGNVDYTGGMVFETTIAQATWAAVQRRNDNSIVLWNPLMQQYGWTSRIEFRIGDLTSDASVREAVARDPHARWTAYVIGAFCFLRNMYEEAFLGGATVYLASDIPLNKGVSSSAAVEVATMKAAAAAYGIELTGVNLAQACQWVENVIAQAPCGVMDQATVVLCEEGHLLPLLCQPCQPFPAIQLPECLELRVIDTGTTHTLAGMECERARAAAFMAYKLICDRENLVITHDESTRIPRPSDPRWNGWLSNVPPSLFRQRYEPQLPESLTGAEYLTLGKKHIDPFSTVKPEIDYPVRGAASYAIEENHRVRLFIALSEWAAAAPEPQALFGQLGELMFQSHYAYAACCLGCSTADMLVEEIRTEGTSSGLYGAKLTGGGAGGTVAVLLHREAESIFRKILDRFAVRSRTEPQVLKGSSPGADHFGIKVI